MENRSVSIIINNYNYSRYLKEAIESALQQLNPPVEIIIVDDGSTDNSADVMHEYANVAKLVFKQNGGQGSAFNAGFKESSGDIIIFLDADDSLLPPAVQIILENFNIETASKIHWPLHVMDEHSIDINQLTPSENLPAGHLLDIVVNNGPNSYLSPPTSGNAWSRKFLEKVLPLPEEVYKISADSYLFMLAPLYGEIQRIDKPLSKYRLHGQNNFRGKPLEEKFLQSKVDRYESSCSILHEHLEKLGHHGDVEKWKGTSWLEKLYAAISDIKQFVPEHHSLILADGDEWQIVNEFANRKFIPFTERNNQYWGLPESDEQAVNEVKRQILNKAGYMFFAWPVFWYLDHYKKLNTYLNETHECLIMNDRLVGYKLINQG